jgi:deoxyadenosine/deoxycytidine kinase
MIAQIVSIEGNIGSGKTTLLSNLKRYFEYNKDVIFLKEPVDQWDAIKDENGVGILEKFYEDQDKYAFSFQMMAYISRLKLFKEEIERLRKEAESQETDIFASDEDRFVTIITERSLFTDKMVFAKMLYDSGKIEKINYDIYINWFDTFAKEYPVKKVIYVNTEPEICHERIVTRDRHGENNISLDYLVNCSKYHDEMLDVTSESCVCEDQLVLNGNCDIYKNTNVLEEWIKDIEEFIYI